MIWVFGDSFSSRYDNDKQGSWARDYVKWEGYAPKVFGDLIATKYNTQINNLSVPACDNDTIFELIIKNAPFIKKNDIVIIGWTSIERFRLCFYGKTFVTFLPSWSDNDTNNYESVGISNSTINDVLINRSQRAHAEEFIIRYDFINWLLRDNKLIQWTPFSHGHFSFHKSYCETVNITQETNGIVDDGHFSKTGHHQLFEYFTSLIEDEVLRIKNNTVIKSYLI